MSEARAPMGATHRIPVIRGARVPACAACSHRHRVTITDPTVAGRSVTFDTGCSECTCTASGHDYDQHGTGTTAVIHIAGNRSNAGPEFAQRRHVDADGRLGVHQDPRVGRPLQRPHSAVRGVRDRVHAAGADLAVTRLFGGAVAGDDGPTGLRSVGALCAVRVAAMVKSIRVWFGVRR